MVPWSKPTQEILTALAVGGDVGQPYQPEDLPGDLAKLAVAVGASGFLGDLALTPHGRAAARVQGIEIDSPFEEQRPLAAALRDARSPEDLKLVALARRLRWGVQRCVSAGDVLVVHATATWTVREPGVFWQAAALFPGAAIA